MTIGPAELARIPVLGRGCRLSTDRTLLMPEGLLKLSGTGLRVLELCDGSRTLDELICELQTGYARETHDRIRADVLGYVEQLLVKKALELAAKPTDLSAAKPRDKGTPPGDS